MIEHYTVKIIGTVHIYQLNNICPISVALNGNKISTCDFSIVDILNLEHKLYFLN